MMIERYKRDLIKEFRNYDKMMLMKDLMAGLTVTAVAIPLALAFGVGSGATAASGLVTAIIAGVIISALGGAYFQISGPTGAMAAFCGMSEENLDRLLLEEFVCCGTDETARPVSEQLGRSHPRGFGSFPRWIRRSLRLGLPLERTIQRLTQLPARIFSLSERGEIRPGFYADLVLFSRESLIDRADFGHPHRLSEGIFSVYVNGELSFFENRVCGHAGKILKK